MKAEPKIPDGWEQVADRRWEAGDHYFRNDMMAWVEIEKPFIGERINALSLGIRRKSSKAKKGGAR